jgi:hypothetical protein
MTSAPASVNSAPDRRWLILGVIGLAQLTAHLAAARLIGRQALTGLALAHGYDIGFWWIAGIFASGAVVAGVLFRRGPLDQQRTPSPRVVRPLRRNAVT